MGLGEAFHIKVHFAEFRHCAVQPEAAIRDGPRKLIGIKGIFAQPKEYAPRRRGVAVMEKDSALIPPSVV